MTGPATEKALSPSLYIMLVWKRIPRCCSSLARRPLYTCHGHVWSTELALCIQSNSTCSARADCVGAAKFAVSGLTTWNSLPPALQAPELLQNAFSQSVSVPCQNSGVGGSHGFFLPSFSHHHNEVQRSKPSHALQPPKQRTSLPSPSSLTLNSSCTPFFKY